MQVQQSPKQSEIQWLSTQSKAYLYGISSFISIVLVQLMIKKLVPFFPAFLSLALRSSIIVLIMFVVLQFRGVSMNIREPTSNYMIKRAFRLLIVRSLINGASITMYSVATQYIDLGIATTFYNTTPLFMFFAEALYFKKYSVQWAHLLITFICFIGVLLIIQPSFIVGQSSASSFECLMYFMVVLAALLSTFALILSHEMRDQIDADLAFIMGSCFHLFPNYLLYMYFKESFSHENGPNFSDLDSQAIIQCCFYMLLFVLFSYVTQIGRIKSMYLSMPSKVTPFQYISVIMGMFLDVYIFDTTYNFPMFIGTVFTSCGLLMKLVVENKQNKQTQ